MIVLAQDSGSLVLDGLKMDGSNFADTLTSDTHEGFGQHLDPVDGRQVGGGSRSGGPPTYPRPSTAGGSQPAAPCPQPLMPACASSPRSPSSEKSPLHITPATPGR